MVRPGVCCIPLRFCMEEDEDEEEEEDDDDEDEIRYKI
jgi:hypothetical protein